MENLRSPGTLGLDSVFKGFLVITRSHELRIGCNLVEIHATGPPELPIQLRDLDNSQRTRKIRQTDRQSDRQTVS